MKLIITADDYGMSEGINESIIEGITRGTITTTNVMINMDCLYKKDIDILKSKKKIASVGLHWNLTAGKPISQVSKINSLVDENGFFYNQHVFLKKIKSKEIKKEHIEHELLEQYNKFKEKFDEPDYWNTHQNIHVNKYLFFIFLNIAKRKNIYFMRNHQRVFVENKGKNNVLTTRKKISEKIKHYVLTFAMLVARYKYKMNYPTRLIAHVNNADKFNFDLIKNIKVHKTWIYELVIHPSKKIDNHFFGSLKEDRIIEDDFFCNNASQAIKEFNANNISLTNFKNIK